MKTATFRFYADLNELLPKHKRQKTFYYPTFGGDQTVKHLIEAQGIPHTEIELILVNGEPVDFDHLVRPDDRISVYPPFTSLNVTQSFRLRPPDPVPIAFLLDNHLGRLARYLRLLGFDALYFNDQLNDEQLAVLSAQENRVLLSRDRGLLKRKQVVLGYCLRTRDPRQQLADVIRRYALAGQISPWSRCLRCNGALRPVTKESIINRLEPKTKRYFDEFQQCLSCEQIYWQGSHFTHLQDFLSQILNEFQATT